MNVEQRLATALRRADTYEPSPDLWSRVAHSIEEDRAHRRRVVRTAVLIAATLAGLVLCGVVALEDGPSGLRVDHVTLELLETVGLIGLILGLGPAVRRFGRGYCDDMFRSSSGFAASLLRVLDAAFYLVFTGYILLSVDFEAPLRTVVLADQLAETTARVGGLLLAMGLLHAVTFMFIPVLALVHNSTRAGRPLPRWVTFLLVIAGAVIGLQLLPSLVALLAGLS